MSGGKPCPRPGAENHLGKVGLTALDNGSPSLANPDSSCYHYVMGNATAAVTAMDRMIEQLSDCLNAESAQRIVALRIDPEIQARVEILAEKASEGLLSEAEGDEYQTYVEMADFIAILKLKAQRLVGSNGPA
jgi:hypothetical protein